MTIKFFVIAALTLNFSHAFANESQVLFDANKGVQYNGTSQLDGSDCSMKFEENGSLRVLYANEQNEMWFGAENFKSSPFSKKLVYQYGGAWTLGCIITGNYCRHTRWDLSYEGDFQVTGFKEAIDGKMVNQCNIHNAQ